MPIVVPDSGPFQDTEIVLDPVEVADNRVELHLNYGAIRVGPEGPDFGDAQIEQYLAEAARGQVPVDYRIPNRTITIPLLLGASGSAGFTSARRQLQAKVARIQDEGGWLKRGSGMYADIVNATLEFPDKHGHLGVEANVLLTLEAIPDFYGDEIELALHPATTGDGHLVFTETEPDGDHPGRVRIVVTNDSSRDLLGLLYGIRSRNYSAEATAQTVYEAEDLTPLDVSTISADAAASGGSTVRHNTERTGTWINMLSTEIDGVGHMTHAGSYRAWALVKSQFAVEDEEPYLRLVYGVGDMVNPEENPPVQWPAATGGYYLVDLGELRLDRAPIGTHRWEGRIQRKGSTGFNEIIWVDKLFVVPADNAYGALRAPQIAQPPAEIVGSDSFASTTAGNALNGSAAPVGTWDSSWTGEDATDFAFTDFSSGEQVGRTAVSSTNGRIATLNTVAITDTEVSADVYCTSFSTAANEVRQAVIARVVDFSNLLRLEARWETDGVSQTPWLSIIQVVGGTPTTLAEAQPDTTPTLGNWHSLRLSVYSNGHVDAEMVNAAGTVIGSLSADSDDLATGGDLEDGLAGIYDYKGGSTAATRYYDNVNVAPLEPLDAVAYAGRTIELRTDGHYRESHDGTGARRVPYGDLPRLPAGGLEDRTVEITLIPSRGDLQEIPSNGLDDISAQVFYRPSWLTMP